jgi:hypothetical protein
MYKKTIAAAFVGIVCLGLSIHADQTATKTQTQDTQPDAGNSVDQGELAAWGIDTAQVGKDYVDGLDNGQYAQSWSKGDQPFQLRISFNCMKCHTVTAGAPIE